MIEDLIKAKKKIAPRAKRSRVKRKSVFPPPISLPAPSPVTELSPGAVEQSNCAARRQHAGLEAAGDRCSSCGYPGEWIGQKADVLKSLDGPPTLIGEAAQHISALLNVMAVKNANDMPMPDGGCLACDDQAEHPGLGTCHCACHAARKWLERLAGRA